jgi:PAS domain S-box-containing protein
VINAQRHAALLDAIQHAVIATDNAGKITYWNDAASALYGWTRDEVSGRNIVDITVPDISREQAATIMKTLAAGELWSGAFNVRSRDGRTFEAAVTDLPLLTSNREVVGVVGVSAPQSSSSAMGSLADELRRAADTVWPSLVNFAIDDDAAAMRPVGTDPQVMQLLALLIMRDRRTLDEGERCDVFITRATSTLAAHFDYAVRAPHLYVRLSTAEKSGPGSILREAMRTRMESRYAALLVGLTGGRLYTGAMPGQPSAAHLFLPAQ